MVYSTVKRTNQVIFAVYVEDFSTAKSTKVSILWFMLTNYSDVKLNHVYDISTVNGQTELIYINANARMTFKHKLKKKILIKFLNLSSKKMKNLRAIFFDFLCLLPDACYRV